MTLVAGGRRFAAPAPLREALRAAGYLPGEGVAEAVVAADRLGRPLLVEGPSGAGKTELAKAVARVLGTRLVRLQCHEGVDEARALYDWNHRKQLLRLQVSTGAWAEARDDVFTEEFLLARPLLEAVRASGDVVLLVDEVDRLDVELEALLLEVLAEHQVSIPELGTVRSDRPPLVFLTSNDTRDLSEALRRRCVVVHLGYPSAERERDVAAGLGGVPAGVAPDPALLDRLAALVAELRAAGVPVSLRENLDAVEALAHLPSGDRGALRAALGATLVKDGRHRAAFEIAFAVFFGEHDHHDDEHGHGHHGHDHDHHQGDDGRLAQILAHAAVHTDGRVDGLERLSAEQLAGMVLQTVLGKGRVPLGRLAREAVRRYGGMESPSTFAYYLYRTLQGLELEALLAGMSPGAGSGAPDPADPAGDPMAERLRQDEVAARVGEVRRAIEAEIRRRLVDERGEAATAAALRPTPTEDVDFVRASRDELARIHEAIGPLARKLGQRLTRRRRHRRRGRLDVRATVRRSIGYGGVLAEPKFRTRRPLRPEVVVLADVSGSVAAFTRFTLHFVYAVNAHFSKVRTFVFVDGVDEVTDVLDGEDDVVAAVHRVIAESDRASLTGISDYGLAFRRFREEHARAVGPRTTVLVLGDARTNDNPPDPSALREIAARARSVLWLNPEPRAFWDTGDSVMGELAEHCEVFECRNLRQLAAFVDQLV